MPPIIKEITLITITINMTSNDSNMSKFNINTGCP